MPALHVGYVGFRFELMEPELVEGYISQGLAIIEATGQPAKPVRARLNCNSEGPWLEEETTQVAVSAAVAWGLHHTDVTEERAIVEFCARLGEDFVTKLGVDSAQAYQLVRENIRDLDPEAHEAWPNDCPNLTRVHEAAEEDVPGEGLH